MNNYLELTIMDGRKITLNHYEIVYYYPAPGEETLKGYAGTYLALRSAKPTDIVEHIKVKELYQEVKAKIEEIEKGSY